jgi:hypothetical protein
MSGLSAAEAIALAQILPTPIEGLLRLSPNFFHLSLTSIMSKLRAESLLPDLPQEILFLICRYVCIYIGRTLIFR